MERKDILSLWFRAMHITEHAKTFLGSTGRRQKHCLSLTITAGSQNGWGWKGPARSRCWGPALVGFEYLQGWSLGAAEPADLQPPGAPSSPGPQQAHTSSSHGLHQKTKSMCQKRLGAVNNEVVTWFFYSSHAQRSCTFFEREIVYFL